MREKRTMQKWEAVLLLAAVAAWGAALRPVTDTAPWWAVALIGAAVVGGVLATWHLLLRPRERVTA